ncbi:MAG: phytanoyl-CoA dioxygenase family protein [Acidimicrobiales bacterium]
MAATETGATMFHPASIGRWGLTADEYWLFRHNGFLRLQHRVPANHVAAMREVIDREIARASPPLRRNDAGQVHRLDRLLDRSPVFLDVLRLPKVIDPLRSLLGPNLFVLRNRHNHATTNRPGDIPFRLHRDIVQWSRPVVTAIVHLEETRVDNGCTHVVPGSHLAAFAGMAPDGGGGNWADDHPEYQAFGGQALPVPMPAGGVLVFDSLLFHSVGTNTTGGTRMSAAFAFHSTDELDDSAQPQRVLLCGERIYKGNDRHYPPHEPSPHGHVPVGRHSDA